MIVSRKSAEGFLGKKLEGLGGGKRSYYVLSSDGTKNLGGPHTKEGAKQRLRQVEFFKRNPETFDCKKLDPALLVLEKPDGLPLWHHVRTATDMRSILRTGFRLGRNPKILPGVYTVPFGWEKPDKKRYKHVLEIRLKKGTVILDTDSERPMHAVAGIGHKSWNALWVHVLKGMGHPFALAKKHNDQDWAAKNEDKLNAFLMGDGRWERREKYVKGMAAELKRCKVDALIQGGEFIILNPKSIASVTEHLKRNPRKNPRTGDTRFGPSDIRYERRFIELEGLDPDLGSGFEVGPGPRYAPHNIDDLLAHVVSARTRNEIIAYANKQDVDWPYRGKWDSQTPWSRGGLLGAGWGNPVSIIYEIFDNAGLEAIEKYPELREVLNSHPEKPKAAAAVAMDWMLNKGIEPYGVTGMGATQRVHTERAMRRLQRANPRKGNPYSSQDATVRPLVWDMFEDVKEAADQGWPNEGKAARGWKSDLVARVKTPMSPVWTKDYTPIKVKGGRFGVRLEIRSGVPTLGGGFFHREKRIVILASPSNIKDLSAFHHQLGSMLRHEIEHAAQHAAGRGSAEYSEDRFAVEFESRDEIEAYATGIYHRAKKERRDFFEVLEKYVEMLRGRAPAARVQKWRDDVAEYAMKRYPNLKKAASMQRENPRKRNPGGLREIYTRFSPNDIRYHRRFIQLSKLPAATAKRLAEVARQSLSVWRRGHSRVISPGEVDRILEDALLSTRPSILTDARVRKGIIDYTDQQEVEWPYRGKWDKWGEPWDQGGLVMVRRASPRRANSVSIIFEIFGEEGLKAIESSSELREILDSHPDNPKVAAAVGTDWMLGHGIEPLFGSRGAMKDLQRANPGDVIPIGRAVGFEHYGEPALPKEVAKRRKERRDKGGFIHEGIPARMLTAEERKKIARLEGNPRPFLKREHDWNEVLIDRAGKKLTRKQIRDYYKLVEKRIWPYLEGQTVMVIFAPKRNEFILRRKRDGDDKYIKLTKRRGIDDQNSLEYWVNRRAIEFHVVLTTKTAPILWLDLDMHTTRDKAARAGLLRKMKKAARRIKKVFRQMGVNRIFVYESGQDGGLHFEGDLPKRRGVDALRKALTKALDKEFEGDEVFTTGPAKSGQIRLDTTTFHHLGSLRAPYSMTIRGTPKKRITT